MAACHVAKECSRVDALICDRTFASLDAVACRMLGSWAGYGLRFIGRWTSDVVSDYLACSCIKIILQVEAIRIGWLGNVIILSRVVIAANCV